MIKEEKLAQDCDTYVIVYPIYLKGVMSKLEPVENVPKDYFNLKDMSPEEKAFYSTSMAESEKEWKGKQNKVVSYSTYKCCNLVAIC